jgi:hypothetical protein
MIGKSKTLLLNTWDNLLGPHSSDRFAHDYNAKCKFCSVNLNASIPAVPGHLNLGEQNLHFAL